ncbi:MAG: hypothetical protein HOY79_34125 [Streptomyces sp.]|nr:hypothetical protein [Streptomyces sp.]NUS11404.1 hypothetical protein [Streptomyces sp.]NUS23455.1 hypothetical protein [Streptomyces sp.]
MNRGWSLHVELHNDDAPESALDVMQEHLAAHAARLGYAPGTDNVSVQMIVDASTARQALDAGIKAVTRAARVAGASPDVLAVELLTEEALDRRLAEPPIPELAGLSEVGEILGVSRQRAGQLAERDGFPPVVALLKSGPVFVAWQVRKFAERVRPPGRPRKATATGAQG